MLRTRPWGSVAAFAVGGIAGTLAIFWSVFAPVLVIALVVLGCRSRPTGDALTAAQRRVEQLDRMRGGQRLPCPLDRVLLISAIEGGLVGLDGTALVREDHGPRAVIGSPGRMEEAFCWT